MIRRVKSVLVLVFLSAAAAVPAGFPWTVDGQTRSVALENLTWKEAEAVLKAQPVVLLAIGARTKEHGPHLPLKTDYVLAEYLKERLAREVPVAASRPSNTATILRSLNTPGRSPSAPKCSRIL